MAMSKIIVYALLLIVTCSACRSPKPCIKNIKRGGHHFEGPHWSATENCLYWVDTFDQKVYKLDAQTNKITSRSIDYGPVTLVVSVKDNPNLILVTVRTEVYFLNWHAPKGDSSLRLLSAVDLGLPNNRCNDGKVDAKGRLWFGNRRTLFSFKSNNLSGSPDGMTIDTDGNLWVACFDGWKVIKINSRTGKLLEQHKLPVSKVTSVMWGGHDLSTLYVTTSRHELSHAELKKQPEAGSLYAITGTGSKGLPENQFRFPNAANY